MRKHNHLFIWALGISMVLVTAAGAYIKYDVLRPLELFQDKNIVELPFFLASDSVAQIVIQDAMDQTEPPENTNAIETQPDETNPSEIPQESTEATSEPTVEPATEPPTQPTTVPDETDPPETDPPATTEPPKTEPPATKPPEAEPPATVPEMPDIDFTGPAVDWSWFDDALFIGDSRTVGLRDYARSGNAEYFCGVGMSSFDILKETASDKNFAEQTLESLLASKTYGKIFINLGINECGYSMSSLIKAYTNVVNTVRQAQPDAKIILHGIMNVGKKKAAGKDYFQPEHLAAINTKIKALTNGTDIFYIDVNDVFTDSDGYLLSSVSGDGCHLYAKYDKVWADWMRYAVAELGL